MIRSMTAYGQEVGQVLDREVSVEIRSVNHRYLDLTIYMPRAYLALEDGLKKIISSRVSRGRVDVWIRLDESAVLSQRLKINLELARAYRDLLINLKEEFQLSGEIGLSQLVGMKDIFSFEEEKMDPDVFFTDLTPILNKALDKFVEMRENEGQALYLDFTERLDLTSGWIKEIESRREDLLIESRTRLEEKMKDLTEGLELDQGRFLQEAAYLAGRSDITEEIIRLKSHLEQFRATLDEGGVVGRRLDFLLQEMNREINTVSSKTGDAGISGLVVDLKSEFEKLREQVQNIE